MRAQAVSSWDLPIRPRAEQPGIGNPVTKAEYNVQTEQLRYSPILHVRVSMYVYVYMYVYIYAHMAGLRLFFVTSRRSWMTA